ncbi:MAG: hypothetical protein AB8G15_09840 [Saprospiraceae bacterium]
MSKKDYTYLKYSLQDLLEEGKQIKVTWDCGGDEAILGIWIDEKRLAYDHELAEALDLYLINYLELPSVGEFQMEGGGSITQTEEGLLFSYLSDVKYVAYEPGEFPPVGEDELTVEEEMAMMYSGKKLLFPS